MQSGCRLSITRTPIHLAIMLMLCVVVFAPRILYAQQIQPDSLKLGVLVDVKFDDVDTLLNQLLDEVQNVLGEETLVVLNSDNNLSNDFDVNLARTNYATLEEDDVDLIIAFGAVNSVVIGAKESFTTPTILFGAVNSDLVDVGEMRDSTGVNNFASLIISQSFRDDLKTFNELFGYERLGVAIEEPVARLMPVGDLFAAETDLLGSSFKLIPFSTEADIIDQLDGIDALYLAGGFYLSDAQMSTLSQALIDRKLPSFTATNKDDVIEGILATNQPSENLGQFFRRIALTVEAFADGQNLSAVPTFIETAGTLSININTAEAIDLPIRYSMIANTDFVGDVKKSAADRTFGFLEFVREALVKNLSLKSSMLGVDLAEADVRTAVRQFYPDLTGFATGSYIDPSLARISGGQNPEFSTSGSISLTQTLFSERLLAAVSIQRNNLESVREDLRSLEYDIVLEASISYLNALIRKANVEIQARNLDLTKRNLALAEQNFEAGQAGIVDVLRFRSEQAQNTQALVEGINSLNSSFFRMNELINNPIDFDIDIEEVALEAGVFQNYEYQQLRSLVDDPTDRQVLVSFLIEEAKNNSPELGGLGFAREITRLNARSFGMRRLLPTVALSGSYNRHFDQWGAGSEPDPILNDNYNVGVRMSIPIFQQGLNRVNRQASEIQLEQLDISIERLERQIELNVNESILDLTNQISNIELSQVAEETARQSLDLAQESYSSGAATLVEVLDAQTNYIQAQLASLTASYSYLISSLTLERFLGHFFLLKSEAENEAFVSRFAEYQSR